MGALHPANRLAAYITGRVSVANKHDTKDVSTAKKISPVAPTIPTSVATTTVTSTLSSIFTLDKPTGRSQLFKLRSPQVLSPFKFALFKAET